MTTFPAVQVSKKDHRWGIDVSARYPEEWKQVMEQIGDGKYCQIVIKAPEKPSTEKQNRLFHGLLGLYFKSGVHSYESYDMMRDTVKYRYGVSHYYVIFSNGNYKIVEDPMEFANRGDVANSGLILVSWSKYNRKQRTEAIKGLVAEMETAGIMQTHYAQQFREMLEEAK